MIDGFINSGYTERENGTSLSINAEIAEREGKFSEGVFRQKYKVSKSDWDVLLCLDIVNNTEWHHTGKNFKETKFFAWGDYNKTDYSDGNFGIESYAYIYQNNKKVIHNIIEKILLNDFKFKDLESKNFIPDLYDYLFRPVRDLVSGTNLEKEYKAEQDKISSMSNVYSSFERRELHENVDENYRREYLDVFKSKYQKIYGDAIEKNKNIDTINSKIKKDNLQLECSESYCIELCKIFGFDENKAYNKALKYKEFVKMKNQEEEYKQKKEDAETRYNSDKKKFEKWINSQIEKGNITYQERIKETNSLFIPEKEEMNGRYGWFNATSRYNLPIYYSGYSFKNKKIMNDYIKKKPVYHLDGLGSVVEIINLKNNKFAVVSPYNSDFVKKAHDLKGQWGKVNRKNGDEIKCWKFENSEKEEVKKVLLQIYGTTGEEKSEKNITLLVKDFSDYVLRGSVVLFGVVVARAFGRDSGVKLGDRIVWLSGEKYSGGSVKNWKTIVENATFKIKNVPYGLLENNENLKKAIQDGWVEIVDEKDNKDEEKNIETIDSILESGKTTLDEKERKLLLSYSGNGGSKTSDERGILDEYYTPDYVCEFMYQLAVKYGYKTGKILEPSCAIGNIIRPFYERNDYNHIDAFEINDKSRKICKLLYPNVKVYENYFETAFLEQPRFSTKLKKGTWLSNAPYDLVIGNPPYGKHTNKFSTYFNGNDRFEQIEMFFMYKGLDLLRSGGLLIYITSTNFLSTGNKYLSAKERIGSIADFIDAYRLPKVFSSTDICTDIIVLRKK